MLLAAGLVILVAWTVAPFDPVGLGPGQDARAYWTVPYDSPYAPGSVGRESAYLYSPAFLQVMLPAQLLPWAPFAAGWTMLLLAVLYWLSGPVLFGPLIVLTFPELWGGNITILIAAAIVIGFRWPAAWVFPILTKLTPGIGALWFVVRREWRAVGEVVLATAAIVAASALLAPGLWAEWLRLLAGSTGSSTVPGSLPVPLVARLPVAAIVVAWAALRGRRWLLPVGVLLAMPVLWWGSFSILAASVALERSAVEGWLLRLLAGRAATT